MKPEAPVPNGLGAGGRVFMTAGDAVDLFREVGNELAALECEALPPLELIQIQDGKVTVLEDDDQWVG